MTSEQSAAGEHPEGYPTRSPFRIEDDEGPQSIAELKTALAPWPEQLAAFLEELEHARHTELAGVVGAARRDWLSLVHPVIQEATARSEGGEVELYTLDEVMADYDPVTFEPREAV